MDGDMRVKCAEIRIFCIILGVWDWLDNEAAAPNRANAQSRKRVTAAQAGRTIQVRHAERTRVPSGCEHYDAPFTEIVLQLWRCWHKMLFVRS